MMKPPTVPTVALETHGCKLNQADTEALARTFLRAGARLVAEGEAADATVVNTCTVTHVADRKARKALRAAHRRRPEALVVATGCYARRATARLADLPEVGLVAAKADCQALVDQVMDRIRGGAGSVPLRSQVSRHRGTAGWPLRTRATVKLQEGCNQACAYCIVPQVRGPQRSLPPESLMEEIRQREREGYRELVLTGTNLGTYGFELASTDLPKFLEQVLACTSVPRLRVSSLQPPGMVPELLRLWAESSGRLCPHFHLPLQSGSNRILRAMRRGYTREEFIEAVQQVRELVPGASVTTDLMVGFPGEQERDFQETLQLSEEVQFSKLHVFRFSRRPGTAAARLDAPVSAAVCERRAARLLELSCALSRSFGRSLLGQKRPVLWETCHYDGGGFVCSGLTDSYVRTTARSSRDLQGMITQAYLAEEGCGGLRACVDETEGY